MKNLERIIYVPVVISETERLRWDALQCNDALDSNGIKGEATELANGVSVFTSSFSDGNELNAVRGELEGIIAAENSESVSSEASSNAGGEATTGEGESDAGEGADSADSNGDD